MPQARLLMKLSLTDSEEASLGTDPLNPDTDGDGFKDGEEVMAKMNPRGQGTLNDMK